MVLEQLERSSCASGRFRDRGIGSYFVNEVYGVRRGVQVGRTGRVTRRCTRADWPRSDRPDRHRGSVRRIPWSGDSWGPRESVGVRMLVITTGPTGLDSPSFHGPLPGNDLDLFWPQPRDLRGPGRDRAATVHADCPAARMTGEPVPAQVGTGPAHPNSQYL